MNKREGAKRISAGIFHPFFIHRVWKPIEFSVIMGLQNIPVVMRIKANIPAEIHRLMEKKLYELIAEMLKDKGLITAGEYIHISRIIQSDFKEKTSEKRKGDE